MATGQTAPTDNNNPTIEEPSEAASVDLVKVVMDAVLIMLRRKVRIAAIVGAATLLAIVVALILKPYYTGTTKLLPPQQSQSISSALLSQLGPLASLVGSASKTPADLYTAILRVDPITEAIIQRYKLKDVYGVPTIAHARRRLLEKTQISSGREGIITVAVEDSDKNRAADLANAYVEEMGKLLQSVAVTEAGQRRLFFANQLANAKENLANAEVELKKIQQQTGLIQPEGQARATIESIARLRGEVTAKRVELQSMRTFATERNPNVVRGESELAALQNQLAQLEGQTKDPTRSSIIAAGDVPSAGLEYVRRLREVKYQETVFELLAKQLEIAKIDESKEAGFIQVLQKAQPPELKSGPYRGGIVAGVFVLSFLLCFLWALGQAWFVQQPLSRQSSEHWRAMQQELRQWRS
jgi:tyrosine-protein kinase Etk/Wzc